ncbi:MAG: Rossmann-like and DUF2520 domain-containing protein [Acidobacteriota bacterium]
MTASDRHRPRDRDLNGLRVTVAGPGRVGGSMALWLTTRGATIARIAGRHEHERARALSTRLGCPWVPIASSTSDDCDLLLLTVADDALEAVTENLARRPRAPVVLHCAGGHGIAPLAPLASLGTSCGTLHPLLSFPTVRPTAPAATVYALTGDPPAFELAHRLALAFDGHPVRVDDDARTRYHLAASLAAGGVATVLAAAFELVDDLDDADAVRGGYLNLTRGVLDAMSTKLDAAGSITGPAVRGDVATVRRHLDLLDHEAPEIGRLTRGLLRETLRQTAVRMTTDDRRRLAETIDDKTRKRPDHGHLHAFDPEPIP